MDEDMYFIATGQRVMQLPAVPFDASGDTMVVLHVNDYAAHATLSVIVSPTNRTPYTIGPLSIPKDLNGNGVPDSGWKALANFASGTYTQIAEPAAISLDEDATPAATVTRVNYGTGMHDVDRGLTGDGFSAFEEYRGAIVRSQHRRLDPNRKDLFAHFDFEFQQFDNVFFRLPLVHHYVDDDEVASDGASLRPLVNPNSDTAGTSPQYALRGRWGASSPTAVDCTDNGRVSPAYTFFFGYTFQVGQNLNQIRYQCAGDPVVLLGSPNETLSVEIFPEAFGKSGINAGDDGVLHSIPPCIDPALTGCDFLDPNGVQIWPGNDRVIDTVLDPRDGYFEALRDCQGHPGFYPPTDLDPLRRQVVAHEGAHGVSVYHPNVIDTTTDRCGALMYHWGDILPIPTDYNGPFDFPQIRTHLKR